MTPIEEAKAKIEDDRRMAKVEFNRRFLALCEEFKARPKAVASFRVVFPTINETTDPHAAASLKAGYLKSLEALNALYGACIEIAAEIETELTQ